MTSLPYHVFFIGPRKTGTTSLHDLLAKEDLPLPQGIKETFFFEQEEVDLDDYETRYGLNPRLPFIEVSPSYFASDEARGHLNRLFPEARIVVTLRDPVKRALSAISHAQRIGMIDKVDAAALRHNKHIFNILRASDYQRCLALWAADFPGQLLVTRQTETGEFHPEVIERMATLTGLNIDIEQLRQMRSNPARVSRSPALIRRGKKMLRALEHVGLGNVRRVLKPYSGWLYQPAPSHADDGLAQLVATELRKECRYYEELPIWQLL